MRTCRVRDDVRAHPAPSPTPARDAPVLSVILPFFRKLGEFRRVLPLNLPHLERPGLEVVIVLDENQEERELVALLRQHPGVRWKVVVNDRPHPWRPPCRSINVGLRHAAGSHVFISSPESAFVGDVPAHALDIARDTPGGIALGRICFARFGDPGETGSLARHFAANIAPESHLHTFYGSICGPRSAFEAVRGYDESLAGWGGDDDNLRIRLEMAGFTLLACPQIRLVHFSFEERAGVVHPRFAYDAVADLVKCTPASALANPGTDWGRDFGRLAYANETPHDSPGGAPGLDGEPPNHSPRPGTVIPAGSRRRCAGCGCLVHYQPHAPHCAGPRDAHAGPQPAAANGRGATGGSAPKIGCVLQLRNEERYLEGCLAHLRDHVDGIIALDDGSTDGTGAILGREPKLLDCIVNPPQREHVWRERENKQRLLRRARDLGMDWVLCCDADERYETAFLADLRAIATSASAAGTSCLSVALKELWDSPRRYRVDGIWGWKYRARFFRLPEQIGFELDKDLHGQWYPDRVRAEGRIAQVDYHLYHLKTIFREDRIKRRDFYKRLDPEGRYQPMGYDYLAEEGEGLRLETIPPGREYDFGTLPADLR